MTVHERVVLRNNAQLSPNQLADGQHQRAAIARALAMEPNVMLCARDFADRVVFIGEGAPSRQAPRVRCCSTRGLSACAFLSRFKA